MNKIICFGLCLLLCSYTKSGRDQFNEVHNSVELILRNADYGGAHVGMQVVSLKNGLEVYQKDATKFFVPASCAKLFTSAAAFEILGVDYRFETEVFTDDLSNLYIKGSGDPSLKTEDLEKIIFQLKLKGVTNINGNIVVDHSEFDDIVQGPGWMWDEGSEYWNSPMSALTINHSCVEVWVEPAQEIGKAPKVTLYPEIDTIAVQNNARTGECKSNLTIGSRRRGQENVITLNGTLLPTDKLKCYRIPLESPPLYTGALFKSLLQKNGITVKGKVISGIVPLKVEKCASHFSEPLSILMRPVNKNTDNLYSNSLFKKIGAKCYGAPGTWVKGAQALRDFLENQVKLDTKNLVLVDGSGESRYNLVSPQQVIKLLTWAKEQPKFAPEFISSLSIAGVDGTLKNRMKFLKGDVRGKTGSMTGVVSVSGYIYNEGEVLAFSIMTNGFVKPCSVFKEEIEDRIISALTKQ